MQAQINGKTFSLSESGWLENRDDWNEEVAEAIAKNAGIKLSEEHWELVRIAREFYEDHFQCCPPRAFSRLLRKKYGKDHCDQKFIYTLFPAGGLVSCINKIAGLPCPCDSAR